MKILFLGDVVGKPGREVLGERLVGLRADLGADVCIANGENAAGGTGLTRATCEEILRAGVDVITAGDHVWKRKEFRAYVTDNLNVIRPANFPDEAPGCGYTVVDAGGANAAAGGADGAGGIGVGVINLLGRTFMKPIDCPFRAVENALEALGDSVSVIVVDMHAEATSDKMAMARYLDGRVTAVFGTHTHVQTADEQVLPGGTAYITDVGMVGPHESILGRKIEAVVTSFSTQLPTKFDVATGDVRICGALVEVDAETGRAISIERVNVSGSK